MGRSVRTSHWPVRSRCLRLARKRNVALSSGSRPPLRRSASREYLHPTCCLCCLPERLSALFSSPAVREHQELKAIVLVGSVQSAVSCRLLPLSSESLSCWDRYAGWMWLVDLFAAAGSLDFRRQHVEVLALAEIPQSVSPPPRPPRAVRSHQSFRWHDRLARNAWRGPPQRRVTVAGVPAFLASS